MPGLGSILTAMVTPFDADLRVDEEAAVALMHHLDEHGSDGLVVCGTTGEASPLTDEEHLRMIELAAGPRFRSNGLRVDDARDHARGGVEQRHRGGRERHRLDQQPGQSRPEQQPRAGRGHAEHELLQA